MSALKLAIFDMDGTIMDSQNIILAAMARAFGAHDLAVPARHKVLSIVGLSLDRAIAQLTPDADQPLRARLAESYKESFVALRRSGGEAVEAPLYPGARAGLAALHARPDVLLGVATGKARRGLDHALAAHDLTGFFITCQTADTHPSKPHPSMLEACLSETGLEAAQAVMIGDTGYDIEMGRAAGIRTIGVTWGYHPAADLRAAGADLLVERFDDIPAALDALWSRAA